MHSVNVSDIRDLHLARSIYLKLTVKVVGRYPKRLLNPIFNINSKGASSMIQMGEFNDYFQIVN